MKHLIAFFLLSLLMGQPYLLAQERCGTTLLLQQREQEDPQLKARLQALNQQLHEWIDANADKAASRAVITIPVVVHVVHNLSEQNITDEQIFSQIQVLNEDYRRLNADRMYTPAIFQGVAADSEIEFVLAKQDPAGNPTTGITRTYTQAQVFQMGNAMKRTETGGKVAWDTKKYLNIWVCNLNSGLLGYASVPGSELAAYDGVVISYKAFGKGGATVAPYNLGRTATHEIGHWLNLQHIWGDNDGSDPCSGTDNVADTPNQALQNEGCPNFPAPTCGNTSDMFMNYMDYTRDACMNLFTKGQKDRMNATLNGVRSGILSSLGGTVPVIKPVCDTLTNAISPDGLVLYRVEEFSDDQTGYLIGHNGYRDAAFAEYIGSVGQKSIARIMFDFARAEFGNPLDSVLVFIRKAATEGPGEVLASRKLAIAAIAANIDNFTYTEVDFAPGITVTGSFYVGFEITYLPGDTVAMYSTQYDEESSGNAWFQDSAGVWSSYDDVYEIAISSGVYVDICSTVSIAETAENVPEVMVYPNPVSEILNISFVEKLFSYEVLSTEGRLVGKGSTATGSVQLPVSRLSNGVYFLRLIAGDKIAGTKFIIQH